MTQFHDDRNAEMRDLFFETTQELLQSLNDDALRLEKAPRDKEIVRSIRRTVHTLKGDSAACGFQELSELAHMMEDALAVEAAADFSLAELAFTAADVFAVTLVAYRQQAALPDATQLRNMVLKLSSRSHADGSSSRRKTLNVGVAWNEYELRAAEAARSEGKQVFHISAHVDPLCAMPIAA